MNYSNGDQIERKADLALVKFLEQCWQLEAGASVANAASEVDARFSGLGLIELDETRQGCPALSRSTIAMWVPLIWLYL